MPTLSHSRVFDIRFIAPEEMREGRLVRRGRIALGDFFEEFEAPIGFWPADRYQHQWHDAAMRFTRGCETSGFIVWAVDFSREAFGLWWPAWTEGSRIALQNQLLFSKEFPNGLDLELAYSKARYAEPWFEDPGNQPSRWHVEHDDIRSFLERAR